MVNTITASTSGIYIFKRIKDDCTNQQKTSKAEYFGIRKLTEREVFRLMDVDDEDFDKLLKTDDNGKRVLSNSALYKLAGNSIVVNCMVEIFRNIWLSDDTPHYKAGDQLTLF